MWFIRKWFQEKNNERSRTERFRLESSFSLISKKPWSINYIEFIPSWTSAVAFWFLCYLSITDGLLQSVMIKNTTGSQFSSVQSLSRVRLFATPWIAARQASLSITNSWSSLRLMSIESVMPSSHLILCRSLLLLPPIPPSIRVFSNESTLRMRWPKYRSFSFSIIPSKG